MLNPDDIIEYHVSQTPAGEQLAFRGIEWGYAQVFHLFSFLGDIAEVTVIKV